MYARITDLDTIRELLGNDDGTQAMVTENSTLSIDYTPGTLYYLYELDGTGEQQDTAVETMLEIVGDRWEDA